MSDINYPEPLSQLVTLGSPVEPWPDYPALYGLTGEHIPELTRMATDAHTWEEDETDPAVHRNVHAWRALAQLHAVEAVPALVVNFGWVDEYQDDWTGEDLPRAIGLIGPDAIPALSDYILDIQHGVWARAAATDSLAEIAKNYPDSGGACAAALTRTLAQYEQNDPIVNADLIVALAHLRLPDTYPLVEQAYRAGKVDLMTMGDWEDFQIEVGLLKERITPEPDRDWDFKSILGAKPKSSKLSSPGKEDKQAKNKRKQEKLSRKKNRKKKKR
jgi:hypothetical protein